MDKIKYFHELTKEEWQALKAEGLTWGEVAKRHPRPEWCNCPDAVMEAFGCWSLIEGDVTGEDYCLNCEHHKSTTDKKVFQNKPRPVQIDRRQRLNKDPILSYAEELSRLYFVLNDTAGKMDIALESAMDYPPELTQKDVFEVRAFLKEADVLVESGFELFAKFSD